jgi:hypothetical protein
MGICYRICYGLDGIARENWSATDMYASTGLQRSAQRLIDEFVSDVAVIEDLLDAEVEQIIREELKLTRLRLRVRSRGSFKNA